MMQCSSVAVEPLIFSICTFGPDWVRAKRIGGLPGIKINDSIALQFLSISPSSSAVPIIVNPTLATHPLCNVIIAK